MPLNPYNPDTIFNPPGTPRPSTSMYPPLAPEDERSLLSRIGGGLASGVGALGNFLDATFGGRAMRGLLGGHPRELLSFLPGSDTVGLTDPEQKTSGRDLLQQWGMVDAPQPGLEWGDIAGFGAEVATSPLTYLNPFGALTKAGRLWSRTSPGTMPKTLGGQIRGGEYAAEQLGQLPPVAKGLLQPGLAATEKASIIPAEVSQAARAQGLELLPRQTRLALHEADIPPVVGTPPPGFMGPQPANPSYAEAIGGLEMGQYPPAGQYVGGASTKGFRTLDVEPPAHGLQGAVRGARHAFVDAPGGGQGTPLASAFGFQIPFFPGSQLNWGTGPWAQKYADVLGGLKQKFLNLPGMVGISNRLNPESANRSLAETQNLAQDVYRPAEKAAMVPVMKTSYDLGGEMAPAMKEMPVVEAQRLATKAAENQPVPLTGAAWRADLAQRDPQQWAKLYGAGGNPNVEDATLQALQQTGQKAGEYQRGLLAGEEALGMPATPRQDYSLHSLVRLEGQAPVKAGAGKSLSARHPSQLPRGELWDPFPDAGSINDLFTARTAAGDLLNVGENRLRSDPEVIKDVLQKIHGPNVPLTLTPEQLKHAEDVAEVLKNADIRRGTQGYFNPNPVEAAGTRGVRHALGTSGAKTNWEFIRQYGKPLAETGEQDVIPVTEHLRNAGLTGPKAPELAAQHLGLETPAELGNYGVPRNMSKDLMDLSRPTSGTSNLYDKALNLYRSWLYGAWPAAQARNRGWGIMSNMLQGQGPLSQWQESRNMGNLLRGTGHVEPPPNLEGLVPGMSEAEVQNLIKREMFGEGAALTQSTRGRTAVENSPRLSSLDRLSQRLPEQPTGQTALQELGSGVKAAFTPKEGQTWRQALDPTNLPGGFHQDVGVGGGNVYFSQMHKLGARVEDMNRGSLYLGLRRKGYSPEAAAQVSNQTHHVYSDLTNWERDVGRRLALFPTFSLRNLPMLARTFGENPAGLNALIKASAGGLRSPGDFVPPYLQESTAVPLGEATPEGTQRYLSGFGFGYEDEGVRALGSLLSAKPGNIQEALGRTAGNVLGQLSPAFKLPIELATGTQLHTGRKLADLRAGTTATGLASLFNEDAAGGLSQILANSPLSRAMTTADTLQDQRKGLLPKAANLLTGVKMTDVDLARQKEIAARQIVEEALKGKTGFGEYERLYVKPEKIGGLSPDQFALMSLYTQLEKRAQEQSKLRKAAQGPPPGIGGP